MRWARHIVYMKEIMGEFKSLVGRGFLGNVPINWGIIVEILGK
jgi:hypothetical protein